MHMANTTVVESNPEENVEPSTVTADDNDIVNQQLSANLNGSGVVEDVPTDNGNGTTPTILPSGASDDLNPDVQDSNSKVTDVNSHVGGVTDVTSTSRLRKFVTSAKERFDNIEPGWAQRKT